MFLLSIITHDKAVDEAIADFLKLIMALIFMTQNWLNDSLRGRDKVNTEL